MIVKLTTVWERAKLLGRSSLARLIVIGGIVVAAAEQITDAIPGDPAAGPTELVLQVAALVTVIWRVVRSATVVPKAMRGLDAPAGRDMWFGPTGGTYSYMPPPSVDRAA